MSPWFDQNPSTSHLRKNYTRQLTNKQKSNCNKNKAHCTKHSKFVCVSFVCFVSFKTEIPHDGIPHSCNMTASNKQLKCANHQLHALKPHFHLFLSRIPILPETLLTTSGNLITQTMGHRYFNLAVTSDIGLRYAHASQKSAFASRSPILRDDHGTLS